MRLQLRRITTSGSYIPEIDGLRFIAILSVVLFHVPVQIVLRSDAEIQTSPFWHLISHGDRGVHLFFLISGFILCMPFAKQHLFPERNKVRLSDYYLRRVTRLEPPFLFANLIRIPLLIFVIHKPAQLVLERGLASIFYLHSAIYGVASYINPPNWSLEVEIQFYCLAPLLAAAYFSIHSAWRRRIVTTAIILLAGIAQNTFLSAATPRLELSIVDYIQYFLAGFVLCDLYLVDWDSIRQHYLWDVASVCCWAWIFIVDGPIVHVLVPVVACIAYIGAFKGVVFRRFFRTSWVCLTGGMCYSLYLTHNLAITGVGLLLHRYLPQNGAPADWQQILVTYALTLPVVLLVGLLLFVTIERPCMDRNWPTKLWHWLTARNAPILPIEEKVK